MFRLDERLARDTIPVVTWPLSRVLLMNDSTWPWVILVPARPDLVEIIDLDPAGRALLLDEIARASAALRAVVRPDKLNVAALGNVVAQLHVHVVARFRADAAWPKPVFGFSKPVPYPPEAARAFVEAFAAASEV